MTRSRWQSAAQEEDAFGDDIEQATKLALSGRDAWEVRTRLKGRVLGPEWLKQISKMTFLGR